MQGQLTGVAGVHHAAAELARKGYIALVTTRNTEAVDIVVISPRTLKTLGIQVKANRKPSSFWLMSRKAKERLYPSNFLYVFVEFEADRRPKFWIVPGITVKRRIWVERAKTGKKQVWFSFLKEDAAPYLEKWNLVGRSLA